MCYKKVSQEPCHHRLTFVSESSVVIEALFADHQVASFHLLVAPHCGHLDCTSNEGWHDDLSLVSAKDDSVKASLHFTLSPVQLGVVDVVVH